MAHNHTITENTCSVCGISEITHMHFGSRVCQACAAFFRRTVSLGIRFVCKFQKSCSLSQGGRIFCRACRFIRCEAVGMKRELVQEPRVTNRIPKYVLKSREEGVREIVRVYATSTIADIRSSETEEAMELKVEEDVELEIAEVNQILNVTQEELLEYYIGQIQTSSHHQATGFRKFSLQDFIKRKTVADHFALQICISCPGTDLLEKEDLVVLFRYSSFANLWMDSAWMHTESMDQLIEDDASKRQTGILSSFITRFSETIGAALSRLRLEVFEYAALKTFCIWKLAMVDSTLTLKMISQEQYSGMTSALNKYYQKNTSLQPHEIATRMAELILLLGPIFDSYRDLLSVYESLEIESIAADNFESRMTP